MAAARSSARASAINCRLGFSLKIVLPAGTRLDIRFDRLRDIVPRRIDHDAAIFPRCAEPAR